MTEPTKQAIKKLFGLSGNLCAFPGCSLPIIESSGSVTGQICHICAKSKGGPRHSGALSTKDVHAFENLILLCPQHHKVVDDQPEIYTAEALLELKAVHESAAGRPELPQDGFYASVLFNAYKSIAIEGNSGNIAINSPGSIQGNIINIRSGSKKTPIQPPPGTLGADPTLSQYVSYLISRYNKFASIEPDRKSAFNYGAISKNIESNFGARWQLLSSDRADDVIGYLQGRINKTRLARTKGKAFSTLDEFIAKHEKKHT